MPEDGAHVVEGRLYVPYHNWFGRLASRFFCELRDNGRLMGTRCTRCGKVYMPPRSLCPGCFERISQWIELPPRGTLLTYTIVNYDYSSECQPGKAPYAVGIIRLDGADTGLCHLIGEAEEEKLRVGMRMEAVFRRERLGNILDIRYFRPQQSGS